MAEDRAPALPVTATEAAGLAREIYGITGAIRALPSEYDHNFQITTPGGPAFVLKVMHQARERSLVDMQAAALARLAGRTPELTPRVREALSGETVVSANPGGGPARLIWMVGHAGGATLAEARPRSPELLERIGEALGLVDAALADFTHAGAERYLKWDLPRAGWIASSLEPIADPAGRALVERALERYEAEVVPALGSLRRSVIHGDANDHNVIVAPGHASSPGSTVIDFGDMHRGLTVAEPAIAAAYALLDTPDPLAAAARVVAGYHSAFPLEESGDRLPLVPRRHPPRRQRHQRGHRAGRADPDDPVPDDQRTRRPGTALERVARACIHALLTTASAPPADCEPVPDARRVREWLATQTARAAPVLDVDLRTSASLVLDLGVGSRLLGADPRAAETGPLTRAITDCDAGSGGRGCGRPLRRGPASSTPRRSFPRASPVDRRAPSTSGAPSIWESISSRRQARRCTRRSTAAWTPSGDNPAPAGLRPAGDPAARSYRRRRGVFHALRPPGRGRARGAGSRATGRRAASDSPGSGHLPATATGRRTCTSRSSSTVWTEAPISRASRGPASGRSGAASRPIPNLLLGIPAVPLPAAPALPRGDASDPRAPIWDAT